VPAVIVVCAENAAVRHRQWGYRADRMRVIPNGYDLSRWQPNLAARARLRAQWGLAHETVLIGAVARWNPLKDHANLLAATALCAAANTSLRCVLAGNGMDESNVPLMSLIDRLGLRGKVILLGERDDIPDVMNALDVHVLSSCAEGFPNVVAEAMATGVACVVTNVGDAARIVGDYGWIAPPRNADALAHAINQAVSLLGTSEMAERIRLGRERVGNLFSLETMVSAYRNVWRRLADDFPQRHQTHPRRLLFVVNNPAFFLSHRLPLALAALQAGMDVHVATMDGPSVPQIVAHGLSHHVIPLSRSGKNPVRELYSIYALWRLFRRLQPRLVHAVTIKPVLYGGIAARAAGVPAFVAAISGLGFIFTRQRRHFDFLRWAATFLYGLALGHPNSRVIFQNADDRDTLRSAGVVSSGQAVLIRGSGVDLAQFQAVPEPPGAPVAIMVARLLVDKGVREFVAAARLAAGHPGGLRWVLAGSPDKGNPASVANEEFAAWRREGVVECLGEQNDIASLYAKSHIAVLPSYREGLPKSLIEAAACGRPIVTTDVPGCRDAMGPGVTGLLVPARDAKALCETALLLAGDGALRREMGAAARRLAEREFDIRHVVQRHLDLYTSLMP
jgi:glycosyltransferase involved in cell wall biosynthesis